MAARDASLTQLRALWSGLTAIQRVVLLGAAVGLVVAFAGVLMWAGSPEYAVLYARLASDDAAEVVARLKADNVSYELRDGGTTVAVPAAQVHELRLTMAGAGIPQGGVVGFEIFDKSGFGMTDFAQKVNYTRALEGELTRTIRRIEGVEGARVHLVLPARRLFEEQAEPATASVVLQMRGARRLGAQQVQGVVHLVASSVEGLEPDQVTVVDNRGNVLYQQSGDEAGMLATTQLEFKRGYEKDVESRVRQMLEQVLGQGSAVVQVAAQFDFDRVEATAETFDPQGAVVRSEERVSETASGGSSPGGTPGVTSNVGDGEQAGGGGNGASSSNRETETVNYEVSKTITRTEKGPGTLKRLSVAVAVDGTYREPKEGEVGPDKVFVPRSAEELGQMRSLVEKAVGFDATRGDAVEVTSIPFRPAEVVDTESSVLGPEIYFSLAKYGLAALLGLLLILFGVRPLVRWLTHSGQITTVTEPMSVAEMERAMAGAGGGAGGPGAGPAEVVFDETPSTEVVRRESLKKRLTEMVVEEPQVAAQLLRSWMTEE
ncbi:MAG: flagellar basal-body MS-ring/collar protein FliF [Deferrisomatales bacterium]|nr:flagellar basal-body MS-ring/collar protein FliF [Deferrisomatales bacterium]